MPAITTNWISGQRILSRWNIKNFELLLLVKKGLQPYSSDLGQPVPPPTMQKKEGFLQDTYGILLDLKSGLEELRIKTGKSTTPQPELVFKDRIDLTSNKTFEVIERALIYRIKEAKKLIEDIKEVFSKESGDWADYTPFSPEEERRIIKELLTHIYKEEEVNRLAGPANRKNIPSARTTLDSKSIRPASTRKPIPAPEKQADNSIPVISFYKKDDSWQIGKEGNEAHLKPLKGYELIQFLIRKENESFDPITLYYKGDVSEELKSLISGTSSQKKYNKKLLTQVKKEIEVLTEKLNESLDIEKGEEIQEKIKKGEKYLKEWNHRFPKFDKAKRNVRELIKRAIEKLHEDAEKKSALSPLKKYLTINGPGQTINIGFWSCYKSNPSNEVKWKLDPN